MRIKYLDNISAIMVLFMVFYHAAVWFGFRDTFVYKFLYGTFFYFMPWFFFKSGMFAKEECIKNTITDGFKSLMIPWLFWGLLSFVILSYIPYYYNRTIWYSMTKIGYTIIVGGYISGDNAPLWFLLSLFLVRVIFCVFRKWPYLLIAASFVCAYLLSIYCHSKHFPLTIGNTLAGLLFYSLGYVMRDYRPDKKTLLLIVPFFILCAIYEASHVDFINNLIESGSYLLWVITSIIGIVCINELFHSLVDRDVFGLSYIGRHSMIIYVTHWPLYWIYNDYVTQILPNSGGGGVFAIIRNYRSMPIPSREIQRM